MHLELPAWHGVGCQTKVYELDVVGAIQQYVLKLDITMHNLHAESLVMSNTAALALLADIFDGK